MKLNKEIVREMCDLTPEKFLERQRKKNLASNAKVDEILEALKKNSKEILGADFADIPFRKSDKHLKRDIKYLLASSAVDSIELCDIPEKRRCFSGK